MKKIKPANKKLLKYLLVLLVIFSIIGFAFRSNVGRIYEYIPQLEIVYTPTKPARRFHYEIFSIDTFNYWVFKLSNEEEKKIIDELDSGNWSEMNSEHIDKLEYFEHYNKIFGNRYKKHKCYICIYNDNNGKVITDSDNHIWQDTSGWIIFLYDTESSRYYCVHESA